MIKLIMFRKPLLFTVMPRNLTGYTYFAEGSQYLKMSSVIR